MCYSKAHMVQNLAVKSTVQKEVILFSFKKNRKSSGYQYLYFIKIRKVCAVVEAIICFHFLTDAR